MMDLSNANLSAIVPVAIQDDKSIISKIVSSVFIICNAKNLASEQKIDRGRNIPVAKIVADRLRQSLNLRDDFNGPEFFENIGIHFSALYPDNSLICKDDNRMVAEELCYYRGLCAMVKLGIDDGKTVTCGDAAIRLLEQIDSVVRCASDFICKRCNHYPTVAVNVRLAGNSEHNILECHISISVKRNK